MSEVPLYMSVSAIGSGGGEGTGASAVGADQVLDEPASGH